MSYTIVGVIGHIDHGKTSLVAALTGVDTDTHPEEKRRGITIDLGFASYHDGEHQFALIDAPGHQKYIGNLLAGVSSVDIGLLVVACDQGIQEQTLEHAAILQSLGVRQLVVAMSRIDLVDDAVKQELSEELDLFLADFGFEEIPKIAISSVTGEGLDELRGLLRRFTRTSNRIIDRSFRLPVDRVFTIDGRGCVVAGTPWSGTISVGDHLQISQSGQVVRVRELEVHGESVQTSQAGLRTAMNLTGASAIEISRGDELVSQGSHPPTHRIAVQLKMFEDSPDLRCPSTVQLHTATTSCSARLTGVRRLSAGEDAIVVIDVAQPIVATLQQKFLLRRPYPIGSFAGGRVLASFRSSDRKTTPILELSRALRNGDAAARLTAWVDYRRELEFDRDWLESSVGIATNDQDDAIERSIAIGRVSRFGDRLVSQATLDRVGAYVKKLLVVRAESDDDAWIDGESLVRRAEGIASPVVVRATVERLISNGDLVRVNRMVAIASEQTVLSKKQRTRMNQVLDLFHDCRSPPSIKEIAQKIGVSIEAVTSLVRFMTQQRVLLEIGDGLFISQDSWVTLLNELQAMFDRKETLSVAEIRDGWQLTRKHVIPMLEYCDRQGFTSRSQDARTAGPELGPATDRGEPARPAPDTQPAASIQAEEQAND